MTAETTKRGLVFSTLKTKTLATLLAVVAAVALPQVFHYLGLVTNMGTTLGETYLPMHLAIFLVGFFAGVWAGALTGIISPVISYAITLALGRAMPAQNMLPYMMIELAAYGIVSGLLARVKMPVIFKLLIAQVAGRGLRAVAIAIGSALGSPIPVSVIWTSLLTGLPGILLQWAIIPLLVFYVEKRAHRD